LVHFFTDGVGVGSIALGPKESLHGLENTLQFKDVPPGGGLSKKAKQMFLP
jgi:hypothetical protein